mgnify:CR=1 FL=1
MNPSTKNNSKSSGRRSGLDLEAYQVILRPVVTEKSMQQSQEEQLNAYTFEVHPQATKDEIKAAVEELLDVQVVKVNTRITITGKHASVRLAEGYDAEDAALKLGAF